MSIMETLDQQHQDQNHEQDNEQRQASETLSSLFDRLDGIEKNQREIVTSFNSVAQNFLSTWQGLEQTQRLMQQLNNSNASANDSHAKTLTKLATTQIEMLELLAGSKVVKLPDGSTVRAADVSAHALMLKVSADITGLRTTNSSLTDALQRQRTINIDHEKLATYLVPGLGKQLLAHERAVQAAFAKANNPMLADLEKSRAVLSETGTQVSEQVRRAGEQVAQLRGAVTWRTVGQISAALLPLAIAVAVVFGAAQTVWAAFGLQPILQTLWASFLSTQEWYWKIAIASAAFVVLAGIGGLTWKIGKKLHELYRRY